MAGRVVASAPANEDGDVLKFLLLPPLNLLLLALAGMVVRRRQRRVGDIMIAAAVGLLLLLSTPLVSALALRTLETYPPLPPGPIAGDAQAIVLLGGDATPVLAEYGDETVGPMSLERVRYAADVQRRSGLPVLVSGGVLAAAKRPVGELMRDVLAKEFRVPVRWTETASRTTAENASLSAAILRREGVTKVLLVTHAWHMPRAVAAFERAGLVVLAAPTRATSAPEWRVRNFLPSADALQRSNYALHEWLGRAWYAARSAGKE
jgi:uncharacterized SAM-binding protein YcdF (DUF218 family)